MSADTHALVYMWTMWSWFVELALPITLMCISQIKIRWPGVYSKHILFTEPSCWPTFGISTVVKNNVKNNVVKNNGSFKATCVCACVCTHLHIYIPWHMCIDRSKLSSPCLKQCLLFSSEYIRLAGPRASVNFIVFVSYLLIEVLRLHIYSTDFIRVLGGLD